MRTLKAKKANDLKLIIARHLDILDGGNVSAEDIRKAESVANLVGKQLKLESVSIAYENLRIRTGKAYGFNGREER
jgi:hypothetical protein